MNPSGSEFTLRVAICDLVERLKRNQHKCSYLEDCRNQLVKEVIRLRLQNEWLAKQISDSPGVSASLPQPLPGPNSASHAQQCLCNNNAQQSSLVHSPQYHTHHFNSGGPHVSEPNAGDVHVASREVDLLCLDNSPNHNSSNNNNRQLHKSNGSVRDESLHLMNILNQFEQEDDAKQDSIKNLTIQMLKDLETEMKTGRLKSDLISLVKSSTANGESLIKFEELDDGQSIEDDDDDVHDAEKEMEEARETANADDTAKASPNNSYNYEAFNNNSDYYTNSHNVNIPLEELYAQNCNIKSSVNKPTIDDEDDDGSKCGSGSNRNSNLNNNSRNSRETTDFSSSPRPASKEHKSGNEFGSRGEAANSFISAAAASTAEMDSDLIIPRNLLPLDLSGRLQDEQQLIKVIAAMRDDFKCLQQHVIASTDRLSKIKSRQLRYFFQKQINLENSAKISSSTIAPNASKKAPNNNSTTTTTSSNNFK